MLARVPWGLAFVPGILLALFGWWRFRRAWRRYSAVETRGAVSGAQAARVLLDRNGMANVELYESGEPGGDHHDPRRRCLFLSAPVAAGRSVAAVATFARVVAHARQFRQDHRLFRLRMATLRATGIVTHGSMLLVVAGLFEPAPRGPLLQAAGAGLYAAFLALNILTLLTVEREAGQTGLQELRRTGLIEDSESDAFARMLGASAWADTPYLLTVVFGLGPLLTGSSARKSRE